MQHNSASFQATFFKFGEGQVQSRYLKFTKFQNSWSRMSDFVHVLANCILKITQPLRSFEM